MKKQRKTKKKRTKLKNKKMMMMKKVMKMMRMKMKMLMLKKEMKIQLNMMYFTILLTLKKHLVFKIQTFSLIS